MTLTKPNTAMVARAQRRYTSDASAPSQERLVVLLYERLLRDLDEAEQALTDGRSAHEPLTHAQDIVAALEAALDPQAWAGASSMAALYDHLHDQLVDANVRRDATKVAHCRTVVAPLAEAWRDAWVQISAAATP